MMITAHKNANYSRDGYKRMKKKKKKNHQEAIKEKFFVSSKEFMSAAMVHQRGH